MNLKETYNYFVKGLDERLQPKFDKLEQQINEIKKMIEDLIKEKK